MSTAWLEKISNGVLPSELLTQEIQRMGDYSGNEPTCLFLDKILTEDDYNKPQINQQDMYYPIWNWEKPNKIRENGISSEQMDEWIIEILISWDLVPASVLSRNENKKA